MLRNEIAEIISLDGNWDFRPDEETAWGVIQVPGAWETQGFSKYFEGPAWYRRIVSIPEHWVGGSIQLELDAVSYACQVRCNGVDVGSHLGMWTPYRLDLTKVIHPGSDNLLEITVEKPGKHYPMRSSLAGFLPDVATTFGGLWQPARLRFLAAALVDFRLETSYDFGQFLIRCQAETFGRRLSGAEWQLEAWLGASPMASLHLPVREDGCLEASLAPEEVRLWSPEQPNLYTMRVTLLEAGQPIAQISQRTGFRCLSTEGNQLLLNGGPFMVRGILSWGWEEDLVAPAYEPERARQEMRRLREMGFNLVKLCLFVPNQAYFDAADEEGMLLWEELPMWLPEVNEQLRRQAPLEYAEIVGLTRHHPSVVLYSLGCELNRTVDGELLSDLDRAVRSQVSDVLVCDNSGSGESYGGLDFDFADFSDYHPYYDIHYFVPLLDNWRRDWQKPRPWIFGEFCDSDTFRDFDEIYRANGGAPPWWLTRENPMTTWRTEAQAMLEARQRLEKASPGLPAKKIIEISYAQSQVIRKYTLEALRRREGMGGYVVTGLKDTPISTSGLWDDLGRAKWSAEDYLPINSDGVLCLDIDRRRQWWHGGDRPVYLDAHNHWSGSVTRWHVVLHLSGAELPSGGRLSWQLKQSEGNVVSSGEILLQSALKPGRPFELGVITCQLPEVGHPVELRLEAQLEAGGSKVFNHWPMWIYPQLPEPSQGWCNFDPAHILDECGEWLARVPRRDSYIYPSQFDLLIAVGWDQGVLEYLTGGGRVLLLQQGNGPLPSRRLPFWREAIKLFQPHPVWEVFPQRGYTDMQFFGLAGDLAFDTERFSQALPGLRDVRPLLRRLDARTFEMTDYIVEARVGAGLLVACALRLQGGAGAQPFGWQRNPAGGFLLSTLCGYLQIAQGDEL